MAEIQKSAPLLILLLFVFPSAALELDIGLDAEVDHDTSDVQVRENFTDIFEANASVYNSGSFECSYRLRANINETDSGESHRVYSRGEDLFPGGRERMHVYYAPINYSGPVEGNLYVEFCGQEEKVGKFSANSTESTVINGTVDVREWKVNETAAEANLNVSEALIVPREVPDYWSVGYSRVKNSSAVLEYNTPVFNDRRNITYVAYNRTSGEILGEAEADLKPGKKLVRKLKERKFQIGLGVSALLNLILVAFLFRIRRKDG